MFVNNKKIYRFKAKDSKKPYLLLSGNVSKYFTVNNMKKKKKTGLSGQLSDFSVDYDVIDISNIISIQTCLMKKAQYK